MRDSRFATGVGRSFRRGEMLALALISSVWIVMLLWTPEDSLRGDVLRFVQIASAPGTPYADFVVEYPPLETISILVIGAGTPMRVAVILAACNAVATLGCWWLLRSRWSPQIGELFLWFVLPLQLFMPFRIDAVPVLLVVIAVVLARDRYEVAAGTVFAAAILFKFWPVVILPVFHFLRRPRALAVAVGLTGLGVASWVALSGFDGVRQVTSYRGAAGWHAESIYGLVTEILPGTEVFQQAGAVRIGEMLAWQMLATRIVTIALVALAWWRPPGRALDPMGGPSLASVATLVVLSPVASPQYVVWLTPFAAIVGAERASRDVRILMLGAGVFASSVFTVYWGFRDPLVLEVLAAGRVICLFGLAVVGFVHRSRSGVSEHTSSDDRPGVAGPLPDVADEQDRPDDDRER